MREIMSDGVLIWISATIGTKEFTKAGLELDLHTFNDRFPLNRRVESGGKILDDFVTGETEEEGLVGGGEVSVIATLESEKIRFAYKFHSPSGLSARTVPVLYDSVILVSYQVFVVVASQTNHLGSAQFIHR